MNYLWWAGKWLEVFFGTWFFSLFQRKYSKDWDKTVLETINEGKFVKFHKNHSQNYTYTAVVQLNGIEYEVWLANKWYAYGYNYAEKDYFKQYRPSIKTMIKLEQWLENYS